MPKDTQLERGGVWDVNTGPMFYVLNHYATLLFW